MAEAAVVWQARVLLRRAQAGTLCTARDGQPFGALVTPACAPDLSVLMLLSSLSEHTRHLRHDPRCAIAVTGVATGPNPQTAPRLTVVGEASVETDKALKARWIARHPYAAFYADFTDFTLFRLATRRRTLYWRFRQRASFEPRRSCRRTMRRSRRSARRRRESSRI